MSLETTIILLLAVLVLALAGAVLLLAWRLARSTRNDPAENRSLADYQVTEMKAELGKVSNLVRELEKDRENKFGQLTSQLRSVGEQTASLNATTDALRQALANSRVRGQWGERMAEDVLGLIGFVEGVNYLKQQTIAGSGVRPDFTFLLPRDLKLNMDVKFPLDNYLKLMDAASDPEREQCRAAFLRDVRGRLKEVVTRDYIDARQNTLPCVLLFIPNERIYQFLQEEDRSLMEESLKNRVVICSPTTLFAILVVIRQAIDNFAVEQTSNEIITELGVFRKQWDEFLRQLEAVGRRIESAQREYQLLIDRRRRALERPLERIEALRESRGLAAASEGSSDAAALANDSARPGLLATEEGETQS